MQPSVDLAATPPLGWNSWNGFGVKVDAESVLAQAEAMVRIGLRELGYSYVVIDDCWSVKAGRDADGFLVADPVRFPEGIAALAQAVHDLGLKLGIYSDAAERTCAGFPGSYGFEDQDAAQWASWGVDYLKYDYCHAPPQQGEAIERYRRMGEALRSTGHAIVYSVCEWGLRDPHLWAAQVGAQLWRSTPDVHDTWDVRPEAPHDWGIDACLDRAHLVAEHGGPGGWNDLDMLVAGLHGRGSIPGPGVTDTEAATQLAMWSMCASPLMIGCDLQTLDSPTAELLLNPELVAVSQDPLGVPARRYLQRDGVEVWRRPLADSTQAVAIVNRGAASASIDLRPGHVALLWGAHPVRDLARRTNLADLTDRLTLELLPHETRVLKIGDAQSAS